MSTVAAAPQATRLPNWQQRLAALLQARQHMPFAWGLNDCASFAAHAVYAQRGTLPRIDLLGQHNARTALRKLQTHGGLVGIATSVLGAPKNANQAAVGDVVLLQLGKRPLLAVCNGTSALAPGPQGLQAVPMQSALCAWGV